MSRYKGPPKWRVDGPTRTNIGPSIRGKPISNPTLLSEDDEFPIREPGTGIATPLGNEGAEKQLGFLRASTISVPGSKAISRNITLTKVAEPSTPADTEPVTPPQPYYAPPSPPQRQMNPVPSSIASKPSGSSVGKHHRKNSSLRSVFGRLFSKKQKNSPSTSLRIPEKSRSRIDLHRSDPTALNRSTKPSPKRSASLPINEFNRALRSHSTAPDNFPLTDLIEVNRDSIQEDGQTGPRRATTPSRLWTPNIQLGYVDWTGLSPRPASSHPRASMIISDVDAAPYIGVAVTSGSHPNRRSRSVGELREASSKSVTRRRSDEIRYWRESYDPGVLSPVSTNKAEAEEPVLMDGGEDEHDVDRESIPQPFIFGPMGEMAGMKITQAASLETRVMTLEKQMQEMKRAVSRIHARASQEQIALQDPPKRSTLRNRSRSIPRPKTNESDISLPRQQRYRGVEPTLAQDSSCTGSQVRSSSYGSGRPSTTSTKQSSQPSYDEPDFSSSQNTARPLSTSTTIRGIPSSSPATSKEEGLNGEHYTILTNMILAEQQARKNLEAVVHGLERELTAVCASMPPIPTLSSNIPPVKESTGPGGEFSSFEQDDSSEDEGRYGCEDFQTPNEENAAFGDEIFGVANQNKEPNHVLRTMSLSQMTLGKGLQPSSKL